MNETSTGRPVIGMADVGEHVEDTLMDLMKMVPNKGDSVIVNGWRITNNGTYYGLGTVQE